MKMLPLLLLNLVMVGGGIVIYDQVRTEPPRTDPGFMTGLDATEVARLVDARLAERPPSEPALRATGSDPRLAARVAALEKQLGARAPVPAADDGIDERERLDERPLAAPLAGSDTAEPSDEEVRRLRKVMERAEELRREEREAERMEQMLERLEIQLTPEQKDKLLASQRAHRVKMGEAMRAVWTSGNAGGDRDAAREAARTAMETLRVEFSRDLATFLSPADAQKISENGGMGGGGFRGAAFRGR